MIKDTQLESIIKMALEKGILEITNKSEPNTDYICAGIVCTVAASNDDLFFLGGDAELDYNGTGKDFLEEKGIDYVANKISNALYDTFYMQQGETDYFLSVLQEMCLNDFGKDNELTEYITSMRDVKNSVIIHSYEGVDGECIPQKNECKLNVVLYDTDELFDFLGITKIYNELEKNYVHADDYVFDHYLVYDVLNDDVFIEASYSFHNNDAEKKFNELSYTMLNSRLGCDLEVKLTAAEKNVIKNIFKDSYMDEIIEQREEYNEQKEALEKKNQMER